MGNIGKFFACLGNCLSKIPWWVWLILVIVGIILGVVSLVVTAVLAGSTIASITLVAFILAGVKGLLAAIGLTFGFCALGCAKEITG